MIKYIKHAYRLAQQSMNDLQHSSKRSSKWPEVEKTFLKENSTCAACGGTEKLQCHHITPFHKNPELELQPSNLITLCMSLDNHCHLLVGHAGNFKGWNETVAIDAAKDLILRKNGDAAGLEDLLAEIKQNIKK